VPVRSRRIACVVIPEFFTDVCVRAHPSLAGRPFAIADGISRREIIACNRQARLVVCGMTPKQARAACPGLAVVARNEKLERAATNEVLDALERCGPDVEALRPGVYFFDATSLPDGESRAAGSAVALVSALGFPAAAAVADDKFTAHCAALTGSGCSVIPVKGSAAFLAPLPVTLLPLAPGDFERFDMLGLRTLGQIAALPVAPLAARFGERARRYAVLAAGADTDPLFPRREQTVYEERFAFDEAVATLEPLFFAVRGCLANIAARLSGAAHACDKVELVLFVEQGEAVAIPVMLAEPTASAVIMFDLARVALEARRQLGAVEAITVRAAPCAQPPPQLGLFDGSKGSRGAALAAALARLHASLSSEEVVTLATQRERSRLPERMQKAVPVASPRQFEPPKKAAAGDSSPAWAPALRLIDPPQSIPAPSERMTCTGPFRLSECWWDRPVDRDYYQLRDRDGALVLAFYDIREDSWYVQGVFD
jgi:protein ImuB